MPKTEQPAREGNVMRIRITHALLDDLDAGEYASARGLVGEMGTLRIMKGGDENLPAAARRWIDAGGIYQVLYHGKTALVGAPLPENP